MLWQFVLLLFLPGWALCESLSLYKKEDSLSKKLGLVIGFSLVLSTVFLSIWSIGVAPINLDAIYVLSVASLTMLIGFAVARRPYLFSKPKGEDAIIGICLVFLGGIVWLAQIKYPIFPANSLTDFVSHTQFSMLVLSSKTTLTQSVFYYGIEFQLAIALLGESAPTVATVRIAMAIITVLSLFVLYVACEKVFHRDVATIFVAIYSFLGFIWVNMVYNSGTWPNYFGILLSVFCFVVFLSVPEMGRIKGNALFIVSLAALAFTHFTSILTIPAFAAYALVTCQFKKPVIDQTRTNLLRYAFRFSRAYLVSAARTLCTSTYFPSLTLLIGGMAVATLILRGFILGVLATELSQPQSVTATTWLSQSFPPSTLQTMVVVYYDDVAFIVLGLLSLLGMAVSIKRLGGDRRPIMFLVWFAFNFALASWTINWRFSYLLMVPLTVFAAVGLNRVFRMQLSDRVSGERALRKGDAHWAAIWSTLLIGFLFITGSRGGIMLIDVTSYPEVAQDQVATYNAIIWANQNLHNGTVLSNAWQFSAYAAVLGKPAFTTHYFPIRDTADAVFLIQRGYIYTYYLTVNATLTQPFKPLWTDGLAHIYAYTPNWSEV